MQVLGKFGRRTTPRSSNRAANMEVQTAACAAIITRTMREATVTDLVTHPASTIACQTGFVASLNHKKYKKAKVPRIQNRPAKRVKSTDTTILRHQGTRMA